MKIVTTRYHNGIGNTVQATVLLVLFSISFVWCIFVSENCSHSGGNTGFEQGDLDYDEETVSEINLKNYDDYDDDGEGDGGAEDDDEYGGKDIDFDSDESLATSTSYYEDEDYHYHHYGKNGTKVVFGLVSCRNGSGTNYLDQTALLIKSILISAEMHNVTRVDFHLFLENTEDEKFFLERLEEMGYPSGYEQVDMNLMVHSAVDVIPAKYKRQMVFQRKYKCGYTRFFFSSALPKVGSIIQLDVSMLVTGNILKVWELFSEIKKDDQVIGIPKVMTLEETRQFMENDRTMSGDTPYPSPKGVNSGILLMNLTKMRAFKFEEKFTRAYVDYSKIARLNPQKTLNILLYYNPGLYYPVPCNFNFLSNNCNSGYTCKAAQKDEQGIHLIQTNSNYNIDNHKVPFHPLLRYYHVYNMVKKGRDPMKDLMIPIRTAYDRKSKLSKCYGKLNKLLFKNFFK